MKKIYLIGVDGGTESLRAGVFDHAGVPLAYAATTYATEFPAPGWAEQNPQDWWSALGQSVREAVKKAGIRPDQVTAMTVDTTCCSVVALDSAGNAVRPALIWMDVRSAKQAEQLVATGDAALCINSNGNGPVSAEWMIPKALWIQQNEPELFDRAFTVCEYQDYLNLHLTGRRVASINNVASRWHYNRSRGGIPQSLLKSLDLEALAEKWPQEVLALGEVIGGLTTGAAEHLGLPTGLPAGLSSRSWQAARSAAPTALRASLQPGRRDLQCAGLLPGSSPTCAPTAALPASSAAGRSACTRSPRAGPPRAPLRHTASHRRRPAHIF